MLAPTLPNMVVMGIEPPNQKMIVNVTPVMPAIHCLFVSSKQGLLYWIQ